MSCLKLHTQVTMHDFLYRYPEGFFTPFFMETQFSLAKFINKPLPQMEWNLADFLEVTMSDMLQKETKKRIFVNVPLTFDRPDGFKFPNEDAMSQNFEFN